MIIVLLNGKRPTDIPFIKNIHWIRHSFKTLSNLFFFILYANIIYHCFAIQGNTVEIQWKYWSIKELWKFWNPFWIHLLTTLIKLLLNFKHQFSKKNSFNVQKGWFKTDFFWYISDFWIGMDCKHYFKDILTKRVSTKIHIGVGGWRCIVLKHLWHSVDFRERYKGYYLLKYSQCYNNVK